MDDLNPSNNQHYQKLHQKWSSKKNGLQKQLWGKHEKALNWINTNAKQLMVGSFGSLMLLTAPVAPFLPASTLSSPHALIKDTEPNEKLVHDLDPVVPKDVRDLIPQEEEHIAAVLSKDFGMPVSAVLDGKRLNRSYGFIGAEQHLMRYPGDTMETHFSSQEEREKYYASGMAPGKGAWGYFASSQAEITEKDIQREKYYIAVQTFLAPEFLSRVGEYRDFFKFRKMLVVNPQNGKAVVAVIGDAGPAVWTGKHLGGSPEVMRHLERVDGKQRGPVLYFFIDDPDDTIPLGPINIVQ